MKWTVHYVKEFEPTEIKGKLVRNPGYPGEATSLNGWPHIPVLLQRKPQFAEAMKISVESTGWRNPITAVCLEEGTYITFGQSRLRLALELQIPLPVLMTDYTETYKDAPIVTEENVLDFFTDKPRNVFWDDWGLTYSYNLERSARKHFDDAGMAWTKELDDVKFIAQEFSWIGD